MKWNDLTMKEKAAMMKVAIQNGIYNLDTIRHKFDEGGELYVVEAGDSLSSIAKKFTGNINNYRDLARYNNIENPNVIMVGQKIYIPKKQDIDTNNTNKSDVSTEPKVLREPAFISKPNALLKREDIERKPKEFKPEYREIPIIVSNSEHIKKPIENKNNSEELSINSKNNSKNNSKIIDKTSKDKKPKNTKNTISSNTSTKDNNSNNTTNVNTLKSISNNNINNTVTHNSEKEYNGAYSIGEVYHDDYIKSNIFDFSPIQIDSNKIIKSKSKLHTNPKKICTVNTPECASFLTINSISPDSKSLNTDYINKYNYRGNAWTWFDNAAKVGIKPVMNIFTDSNKFTGEEDKYQVIYKTRQLSKTKEYKDKILSSIQPGSVVTLLYPGSDKFDIAKKESNGKVLSTHIGDVIERDGKLYIRDNVHGRIKERPLEDVINGKQRDGVLITGIINYPNDGYDYTDLSELGYSYSPELLRNDRIGSKAMYRALSAIKKNEENLIKDGISKEELEQYKDIVQGILYKESGGGTADNYLKDANNYSLKHSIDAISYKQPSLDRFESKGMSNIKYFGNRGDGKPFFTKEELSKYGIDEANYTDYKKMETPEVSGVMSIVALHKKAKELKEIMSDLPYSIKNDKKLFEALLISSWNQGTKNIRANVNKYKKNKDKRELYQYMNTDYVSSVNLYRNYLPYNKDSNILDKIYYGDLKPNNLNKKQIIELQKDLYKNGYLKESDIDGIIGPKTRSALVYMINDKDIEKINTDKKEEEIKKYNSEKAASLFESLLYPKGKTVFNWQD